VAIEQCPRIESNETMIFVASEEAVSVQVLVVNLQVKLIKISISGYKFSFRVTC